MAKIRKQWISREEYEGGIAGGGSGYYTIPEIDAYFEGEASGKKQVHWDRVTSKPSTFTPSAHVLSGATHTASGLTTGYVIKATGATSFAFQVNNLGGLSDVNLGSLEEGETIMYDQGTSMWIDAWGIEYDNPRLVWKMYTDFFSAGVNSNDPWLGALFGGSLSAVAATSNHPGIVRFASNLADQGCRFMTATNCIRIAGAEHSEFCFKTQTLLNIRVRLGFQDSLTDTLPTDGVYIDITGTTLTGKTRNNGSGSTTGTSHTLSTSTWYRAKIAVNSDATLVTFTLYSAAGTQLWTNTLSANIPTANGRETGHGIVMYVATSVARTFDVDMMIASRAGTLTR